MDALIQLLILDELGLQQHISLESSDKCWYWRTYTTGKKYNYSESNQLIKNFKINPNENHRQQHKLDAIEQIAKEFCRIVPMQACQNYTFVPIPPSKPVTSVDYDDRLQKVLKRVGELKAVKLDIRELVEQTSETQAAHLVASSDRMTAHDLVSIYRINEDLIEPKPEKIVIFDDVLTMGNHFKAVQQKLNNYYKAVPMVGLFIARSTNDLFARQSS